MKACVIGFGSLETFFFYNTVKPCPPVSQVMIELDMTNVDVLYLSFHVINFLKYLLLLSLYPLFI